MPSTHPLSAFITLASLAIAALPIAAVAHPATSCETGYVEWEGRSPEEIVAKSHTIFLATVAEFVPDDTRPGYDGYYVLVSTGVELKGGGQGKVTVYGKAPYQVPPQNYFDLTAKHNQMVERYRQSGSAQLGGIANYTEFGRHCPVAPRFVIGYQYLALLGTDSLLSFEPIHDTVGDLWLRLVRQLALDEPR